MAHVLGCANKLHDNEIVHVRFEVRSRHISSCHVPCFKCLNDDQERQHICRDSWGSSLGFLIEVALGPIIRTGSPLKLTVSLFFEYIDGP
jgi:hypothetical protein